MVAANEIPYICSGIASWITGSNGLYLATKAFSSVIPAGINAYFLLGVLAGVLAIFHMFNHYAVVRMSADNTWSLLLGWLVVLVLELIVAIAVTFYIIRARNVELLEALGLCKGTDFKQRDLCIDGGFTVYLIVMNLLIFVFCMLPFCVRAYTYVRCEHHTRPANDRPVEQKPLFQASSNV